jgi:hypothetical protein
MYSPPFHPAERVPAPLPASERPRLLVVIDTEEEFDWEADPAFDRANTSIEAMRDAYRAQNVFEELGIVPTWAIDFPIASQPIGSERLREWQASGKALVGAHLHPWVSPPHEEEVNARNSYPGNLPAQLERAKLAELTREIEERFGRRPTVYKAGRYGFGPNTAATLVELGYTVDLSACPAFDHSADGGPDYSTLGPEPYWFGPGRALLGIPTTGAFVGWMASLAGKGAPGLHRAVHRPPFLQARVPGILSRARALERLMLSPEGHGGVHLRRLTRALLDRGVRTFTFSFHSPSLRPGCTPYIRDTRQLVEFLATCREYFSWFLSELGGVATTPLELRELLSTLRPEPVA